MGSSGNLQAVGGEGIDAASKARQEHLYGQAERFAATNPFSQRYGGQVPGMTAMGQAGQQFLTNRLLGPNAYQAQNLGFQNYQPQFTYQPQGGSGYTPFVPQQPQQAPQTSPEQVQQFQQQTAQQQRNFGAEGSPDDMIMSGGKPSDEPFRPKSGDGSQMYGGGPRFEGGGDIGMGQGFADSGERDRPSRQAQMPPQNVGFGRPDEVMVRRDGGGRGDMQFGGPGLEAPAVLKALPKPSIGDMRFTGKAPPKSSVGDMRFRGPVRQPRVETGRGRGERVADVIGMKAPLMEEPLSRDDGPPIMPQQMTQQILPGQSPQPMARDQRPPAPAGPQPFVPAAIGAMEGILNRQEPSAIAAQTVGAPEGVGVNTLTGVTTGGLDAIDAASIDSPIATTGVTTQGLEAINEQAITGPTAITPQTINAASGLGRPEGEGIQAYMDATGVSAQVDQAQQDYEQQLNALQAQQAGSGAFGSRAQLQDLGAMGQHLRNIGQIRAAGFDKAAQRMEADLGREQQATMQTAQLGQQAALQEQQLSQQAGTREAELSQQARLQQQNIEAQRRQQDAAREQQARLQTQQLTQAGDIRGAELGQQAALQAQQLEAQRRQQDAAREQQARMQGQQLGTQAALDTQRLGQQALMADADRALRAAQLTQQGSQQYVDNQLRAAGALGQEERATAAALQNMGRDQRDIQQEQMAFDYEQWLRSQEGGGRELAMLQSMLPESQRLQMEREQGLGSKIFGGLLAGGGIASKFFGG